MKLQGADGLVRRLHALQHSGESIAERWAREASDAAKGMVPVRTGALQRSIHPGDASSEGSTVLANKSAIYVDRGTSAHTIVPKGSVLAFKDQGRTVFSKRVQHPGGKPQPFTQRAATEGMRRTSMKDEVINRWNGAA